MFVIKRLMIKSINTYVRFYSLGKKSHYDVLHLRRNCTDKEIKDAFIQMSKEYHPDKNKDARAQDQFVQIVEAYNVLGKASSRAQYDMQTSNKSYDNNSYPPSYMYNHTPYNIRRNAQNTYTYHHEANTQSTQEPAQEKTKSYYGTTGMKKVPNYMIIMMCCGFAMFGLVVQLLIIRRSFKIHQENVIERSKMLSEELDRVRAAAEANGNTKQTRLLLEKIVQSANPTIATASLGQALANEKK